VARSTKHASKNRNWLLLWASWQSQIVCQKRTSDFSSISPLLKWRLLRLVLSYVNRTSKPQPWTGLWLRSTSTILMYKWKGGVLRVRHDMRNAGRPIGFWGAVQRLRNIRSPRVWRNSIYVVEIVSREGFTAINVTGDLDNYEHRNDVMIRTILIGMDSPTTIPIRGGNYYPLRSPIHAPLSFSR